MAILPTSLARKYRLHVPAGAEGERPLVLMLHGCGQTADDFAASTRMSERAGARGCYVAYPAQSARANRGRCWNWFRPDHQRHGEGEPAALEAIVRDVMARHPIDARRVHVAGFSAGGAMAAIMGATYPELFAAVGVHSGLAYGAAHSVGTAMAAMRGASVDVFFRSPGAPGLGIPTIIFHGNNDTTVHPRNGEALLAQWFACQSWGSVAGSRMQQEEGEKEGRRYVRRFVEDPGGAPLMEHWAIEGLGHAWSGGSGAGSFADPHGPDASAQMLRFFLGRSRA